MAKKTAGSPQSSRPQLELSVHRQSKGISLQEIVERTKISRRFLQAIEAEDFDQLPGGIFTTSYLRQYAVLIGYDEDALVRYYRCRTGQQPEANCGSETTRERPARKRFAPLRWLPFSTTL
ncbi:MAG: helix-turn-helix domain-containing protein [Bryobacteraceae bacterium]